MKSTFIILASAAALAAPAAPAAADSAVAPRPTLAPELELHGYGELHAGFFAYGPDSNREGGAPRDRRVELDTTRLALELELEWEGGLEVEAEIELEHGGTGGAMELEYEEFGEFEKEIEQGGEVVVEELYVKKELGERVAVSVGRFYVAVGQLSRYYKPTAYLGTSRAEGEVAVIPQVWDELGAQVQVHLGAVELTAQLVNGLDSTAFSSQRWVALGHQGRFETIRATDPAGVVRIDVQPRAGVEVGASIYAGGAANNRPKDDLDVAAPVVIGDVHGAFALGPVRGQALVLGGWLGNADEVSARNERLSNELDVLRSPVSDGALCAWAEVGYDVAPSLALADARLEPFVRLERYDTMFRPRAELFDNPRFERTVVVAGVSYQLHGSVFAKLDVAHRRFGSSELRAENAARATTGFVF